jgi:predicted DNA-binding ribbon-helix-helix protein
MKSPVVKRSIVVAGHKTSVSLEEAFWNGMKEISGLRNMTLSELVGEIDSNRQQGNLPRSGCSCWIISGRARWLPHRMQSRWASRGSLGLAVQTGILCDLADASRACDDAERITHEIGVAGFQRRRNVGHLPRIGGRGRFPE